MRDVSAIQADLQRLAARIARARNDCVDLVAELNRDHLPRGPEYEQMAEDDVAPSVPYYLAGVLDVVESDDLQKVEQDLREAATITAAELVREFEQRGTPPPDRPE